MTKINFPKEARTKWLEALRSGKYKQGMKALKNSDGSMCCLGVLCDVHGVTWSQPYGGTYRTKADSYAYPQPDDVGEDVCDALNMIVDDETKFYAMLANMNDHDSKNFDDIADYIEKVTVAA